MKDQEEIKERIKELYEMTLDDVSQYGTASQYITDEIETLEWVLDE